MRERLDLSSRWLNCEIVVLSSCSLRSRQQLTALRLPGRETSVLRVLQTFMEQPLRWGNVLWTNRYVGAHATIKRSASGCPRSSLVW